MAKGKTKGKSRKHKNKKITGRQAPRSRSAKNARKSISESYEIDLDMTDKSLRDFQASKSITVATTKSDITSSKIGELYDVKPIHENIQNLCQLKVAGKIAKEYPNEEIPKHVPKHICKCLFEKNSGLRIAELEKLVKNKMDTPASSCITILDQHSRYRATRASRSSRASKSSN
jgi:hypothetical protein